MRRLADDLYWLWFDLPFRLNHINLYVLDCADGWTVIDCGVNDAATASHWQALLEGPLADQPVRRIIVSHNHVDHIGYAAPLAAITGAEIIMGKVEYDPHQPDAGDGRSGFRGCPQAAYRRYGMDEDALAMAREDHDRYSRFCRPLPEINLIEAGAVIEDVWEIRIDHGHSIGQLGFTDHDRGLYIAVVPCAQISPNISADFETPEVDKLGPYLEYLKAMTQLDPAMLILLGHDWPFSKNVNGR